MHPTAQSQGTLPNKVILKKTKKTESSCNRRRLGPNDTERTMAVTAGRKKDEVRKTYATIQKTQSHPSWVYVGNLVPSVTHEQLRQIFSSFGTIKHVTMRCSRGRAVANVTDVPNGVLSDRDRLYASIEFREYWAARRAVEANGIVLKSQPIVVVISAADLPEVADIVECKRITAA